MSEKVRVILSQILSKLENGKPYMRNMKKLFRHIITKPTEGKTLLIARKKSALLREEESRQILWDMSKQQGGGQLQITEGELSSLVLCPEKLSSKNKQTKKIEYKMKAFQKQEASREA